MNEIHRCFQQIEWLGRTWQGRAGQGRTGQGGAEHDRTGQERAGQDRTGQDRTRYQVLAFGRLADYHEASGEGGCAAGCHLLVHCDAHWSSGVKTRPGPGFPRRREHCRFARSARCAGLFRENLAGPSVPASLPPSRSGCAEDCERLAVRALVAGGVFARLAGPSEDEAGLAGAVWALARPFGGDTEGEEGEGEGPREGQLPDLLGPLGPACEALGASYSSTLIPSQRALAKLGLSWLGTRMPHACAPHGWRCHGRGMAGRFAPCEDCSGWGNRETLIAASSLPPRADATWPGVAHAAKPSACRKGQRHLRTLAASA